MRRLLLSLLAISAASAASAAAKFDQKVDKSLQQPDRLWSDGFLKTEFLFPPVREDLESKDDDAVEADTLAPPQPATVKFPSDPDRIPRRKRLRRAAPRRSEFDGEMDSFLRSSTKSKPVLTSSDDFSDDAFWREIEKKAMEDIAESKMKAKSSSSDAFSEDESAGKELAALSESIDDPLLRGEKVPLPSSSFKEEHFVGTKAPSMLNQESITATAAAGMVGTKFTDWTNDTKDDFEAWLRSKGEAVPNDLFETTTIRPPSPPPQEAFETTTVRISAPVRTAPTIAPIQVDPWITAPVPDSFTAIPSIQEPPTQSTPPWTQQPTTAQPWTPPPTQPWTQEHTTTEPWIQLQTTTQPWTQQPETTTPQLPALPPDLTPLAPTVTGEVEHVDEGVDPDFPVGPPRARGLHNVPEGHNLDRQIDWDFKRGFRVLNKETTDSVRAPFDVVVRCPNPSGNAAPYYPDAVPPPSESTSIIVRPVDELPTEAYTEQPQSTYAASYGRKDADVVAALVQGLVGGSTAPAAPLQYPSTPQQATPQYSVPPGYVAVPESWFNKPTEVIGRSQYESAPTELLLQLQQEARQRQQLESEQPWLAQSDPQQLQRLQQQGGFRADNSAFTGRTSIGTTITDPNFYFPEANGALYLGRPQTVFYARPRQLQRDPVIVGATPDWALGPQRLFKLDPRTPAAEWYGQSMANFVPGAQHPYPTPPRFQAWYGSAGSGPSLASFLPRSQGAYPSRYPTWPGSGYAAASQYAG